MTTSPPCAHLWYTEGHRWNHYQVCINGTLACFRLHHDTDICWELIKMFPDDQKTYEPFGLTERRGEKSVHTLDFEWLADLLRKDMVLYSFSRPSTSLVYDDRPFAYHGVTFHSKKFIYEESPYKNENVE